MKKPQTKPTQQPALTTVDQPKLTDVRGGASGQRKMNPSDTGSFVS